MMNEDTAAAHRVAGNQALRRLPPTEPTPRTIIFNPVSGPGEPRGAFAHIDAVRVFAIVCVVGTHAAVVMLERLTPAEAASAGGAAFATAAAIAFEGATHYLVILAGLLYAMVLQRRPYRAFLKRRVLTIAAPYLVLCAVYTVLVIEGPRPALNTAPPADLAAAWLGFALRGDASGHLWFVPVALILFALSPIFSWLAQRPSRAWALVILASLPLLAPRDHAGPMWLLLAHFAGGYAVGVWAGQNYARTLAWLTRWRLPLVGVTAALAVAAAVIVHGELGVSSPAATPWPDVRSGLFYLLRLCLLGALLAALSALEPTLRSQAWMKEFATRGFAIYLLHGTLVVFIGRLLAQFVVSPAAAAFAALAVALWALVASWLIVSAARAVLGARSRYIVGA